MDALTPRDGEDQPRQANPSARARAKTEKTGIVPRRTAADANNPLGWLNLERVHINYKGMGGFESHYESAEWKNLTKGHFITEQLVAVPGSLPPPLPEAEVDKNVKDEVSHQPLARLNSTLAATPGKDGQALRRALLSGTTIVFFTPGYEGKRFIYQRAKELGVSSVIIDSPDSWASKLVDEHIIKKFIPLNMEQDAESVFKDALEVIRALEDDAVVGRAAGVCTFCELSVPMVARLANALGLPSSPASAIDLARNKHSTRQAMKDAGLATVANSLIRNTADLAAGMAHVGFPAVLKPISGAASLGVKKVDSEEQLYEAFHHVKEEMESTVISSGALVKTKTIDRDLPAVEGKSLAELHLPTKKKDIECLFMLEEYLDGPEVDVDVVMSEGEAQYVVVVDNGPTVEPYFNETWGLCPSQLDKAKCAELEEMAVASLKACGFTTGVFHVELKYTSRGPRLIEINARMGGGQVRDTHLLVYDVDLVEETLFSAVGIPNRPCKADPPNCTLAYNYVNAKKSGKVLSLKALADLAQKPGVIYAKPLVKEGDWITGPEEGMPTWIADIMVRSNDPDTALRYVLEMSEKLDVPLKAAPQQHVTVTH